MDQQHIKKVFMIAGWRDLPPELLTLISKRLISVSDYISFRGICKSWRSAATFDNFDCAFPQVPRIMIEARERGVHKLATKFTNMSYAHMYPSLLIEEGQDPDRYYFSCSGWLLRLVRNKCSVVLTNPITCDRFMLPGLDTFTGLLDRSSILKMVLSGSPTILPHLVIMVIWGRERQLGFCRVGDSSWTVMEYWDRPFMDILYHKGKLYALDDKFRVVECDIRGLNPTRVQQILRLPSYRGGMCYMAESSGKILIVYPFTRFYEYDLIDGSYKQIYDLGNRALFLSWASSSLCLEDFAWNDEVQSNCIYFPWGEVYNMAERVLKKFFCIDDAKPNCPPIWFVPGV